MEQSLFWRDGVAAVLNVLCGVTIQIEETGVIGNFITLYRTIQRMQLENGMRLIEGGE